MSAPEQVVERKLYFKPGFVLETELETRAGTTVPDIIGPPGINPVDPTKLLFP